MEFRSQGKTTVAWRFFSRARITLTVAACLLFALAYSGVAGTRSGTTDESFIVTLRGGLTAADDSEYDNYSAGSHGGLGLSVGVRAGSLVIEAGPHFIYHHIPKEPIRVGLFEQKRSYNAFALTLETKFAPDVPWISRPYATLGFGIFDLSGGASFGVGADMKFTRWGKRLLFAEVSYCSFAVDFWRLSMGIRLY